MAINLQQVDEKSFLKKRVVLFRAPQAAVAAKFLAVANLSALTVGTAVTLLETFVRYPRKVLFTYVIANPTVVVWSIVGLRNGKVVTETVTHTVAASGVDKSAMVYDSLISITPISISVTSTNTVSIGTEGATGCLGLPSAIKSVNDVKQIVPIAGTTEGTPIVISATTVDVANSAIITGTALIATTDWEVVYMSNGDDAPGLGTQGVYAA